MANFTILYENFADSGILAGGSWLTSLPLTNLQNKDIQRVARSSDAGNSSTILTLNLGSVLPVGGIAFGPTNMSAGSSWRIRAYLESSYTTVVYDTGVQLVSGIAVDWSDTADWLEWEDPGFWVGLSDFAQFNELPLFNYHVVPSASTTAATAQYWKLEVFDAGNADGQIDIGRLVVARAYSPSTNYSQDNQMSLVPLTDTEESLGGLRVFWVRGLRRSFRCNFPTLEESEIFNDVFRLMLRSGISRQVFVVPDPEDEDTGRRRSFLATFKQIPALQQLLAERGSTAFDLEEVL